MKHGWMKPAELFGLKSFWIMGIHKDHRFCKQRYSTQSNNNKTLKANRYSYFQYILSLLLQHRKTRGKILNIYCITSRQYIAKWDFSCTLQAVLYKVPELYEINKSTKCMLQGREGEVVAQWYTSNHEVPGSIPAWGGMVNDLARALTPTCGNAMG